MEALARITRFIMSGSVGAATNIGILYILVEFLGLYPVTASVISFTCAVGVSFALQKFWTFTNHDLSNTHHQAARFVVVALVNLGINSLLMYVFIEYLHMHYIVSQIITAGMVAVESYFVYQYLVFTDTRMPRVE